MTKLKLSAIPDDKPVRLTVELPAQVHRDLVNYAAAIVRETPGATPIEATKLVAPMLARFMATDREFMKSRRCPAARRRRARS